MLHRIIALAALFVLLIVALGGARTSDAATNLWPSIMPIHTELQYVATGASHYAYDPRRELIYANAPDGILPITLSGQTLPPFAAGWNAVEMTISPDGEILYLLDWLRPSIVLIDLDTHALLDEWPLPTSRGAPAFGQTMIALPGEPAVLIARGGLGGALSYGLGVIDAEGLRPATVEAMDSPHLLLSDDPNTVFGLFHNTFLVLRVDETGVSLTSSHDDLVAYSTFAYADGLLFGRDGSLASAETFQRLGRFATNGSVVPDVARGYATYLHEVMNDGVYLQVFEIATFRKIAEGVLTLEPYESLSHADGLIRTGDDSYAILASNGLYLLHFDIYDHAVAVPVVANEYCADFFDDFSGPTPFPWPTRNDTAGLVVVDGGELHVAARTAAPVLVGAPVCFRPNFELTVDVREVGDEPGYYGLLFQYEEGGLVYVGGMVNPRDQWWNKSLAGGHGEFNDVIHPDGAVNRVRITYWQTILDGTLTLYVNDVKMKSWSNTRLPARSAVVGLVVLPHWSNRAAARFDNFRFSAVTREPLD